MLTRKSVARLAVCAALLGIVTTGAAQIPPLPAEKPPTHVALKPAGAPAAGALAGVTVALEIQAQQPNVPAGLHGTIVLTNGGTTAVELTDPRDTSQLEVQTSAGRAVRTAPGSPSAPGHVHGAAAAGPVRLAPKESRRLDIVVTDVMPEGDAAPPPVTGPVPPGTARSNTAPLLAGNYRVRARVRLTPATGKAGDAKTSTDFESGWVDVAFGTK